MGATAYRDAMLARLEWMGADQLAAIQEAGRVVAEAIGGGGRVWVARTSHCLHDEATYRAGGLMAVHVLNDPITIQRGDAVLIGTNAGTTNLTVATAMIAHDRGALVIVLTQMPYETHPEALPEHPSGTRLAEHADVLVDLGGQYGDGELPSPDEALRIMPGSGVAGMMAMWMIFAEATELLAAQGKTPHFWQSIQMPGAAERNAEELGEYHRTGLGYRPIE